MTAPHGTLDEGAAMAAGTRPLRKLPVVVDATPAARQDAAPADDGPRAPGRRALPTLNTDGSRFLIRPRLSPGRFLRRRRIIGYTLIALFVLLPHLRIGGRPPILVDLVQREISLFGAVFRPSEGALLMLLGLTVVLTVFFVTALWGRVWCGYGCPQTVYLELVFRPIERWLEGPPARQRQLDAQGGSWRRKVKWGIYAVLAFALANVFLSYFVPTDQLWRWVTHSPARHPGGFAVVMAVTALMFFDFAYAREQVCTVACPYGRLQSVLLDRRSLVVGYDARRGEPRGKAEKRKGSEPAPADPAQVAALPAGRCVDCNACVATCPTGIDIREGLQMECIGCAQCIDACDAIMAKVGQAPGLIRYASQDELAGTPRRPMRARIAIYLGLLTVVAGLLVTRLAGRGDTELWVLRNDEAAFQVLEDGRVSSLVRVKIENRGSDKRRYALALADDPSAQLIVSQPRLEVSGGSSLVVTTFVLSPAGSFQGGKRLTALAVTEDGAPLARLPVTLLGPDAAAPAPTTTNPEPAK